MTHKILNQLFWEININPIGNNSLRSIPNEIYSISGMKDFILGKSEHFSQSSCWEELDRASPHDWSGTPQLKLSRTLCSFLFYYLGNNDLKSLPGKIGSMTGLEKLDLRKLIVIMQDSKTKQIININHSWKTKCVQFFTNCIPHKFVFAHLNAVQHKTIETNTLKCIPSSIGLMIGLEWLDLSEWFFKL